jgi:hypothetical protein
MNNNIVSVPSTKTDDKPNFDLRISGYVATPNDPKSEGRLTIEVGLLRIAGIQFFHDRAGQFVTRPPYTLTTEDGRRYPTPAVWLLNSQLKQKFDRAVEAALAEDLGGANVA